MFYIKSPYNENELIQSTIGKVLIFSIFLMFWAAIFFPAVKLFTLMGGDLSAVIFATTYGATVMITVTALLTHCESTPWYRTTIFNPISSMNKTALRSDFVPVTVVRD